MDILANVINGQGMQGLYALCQIPLQKPSSQQSEVTQRNKKGNRVHAEYLFNSPPGLPAPPHRKTLRQQQISQHNCSSMGGPNAFITGAASGIGAALVQHLVSQGYTGLTVRVLVWVWVGVPPCRRQPACGAVSPLPSALQPFQLLFVLLLITFRSWTWTQRRSCSR